MGDFMVKNVVLLVTPIGADKMEIIYHKNPKWRQQPIAILKKNSK